MEIFGPGLGVLPKLFKGVIGTGCWPWNRSCFVWDVQIRQTFAALLIEPQLLVMTLGCDSPVWFFFARLPDLNTSDVSLRQALSSSEGRQ